MCSVDAELYVAEVAVVEIVAAVAVAATAVEFDHAADFALQTSQLSQHLSHCLLSTNKGFLKVLLNKMLSLLMALAASSRLKKKKM